MTSDDELATRAQILHAAHNHPGSGHLCGGCLREAAGETRYRRAWWRLVAAVLAVAVVVVMCGVVPRADAEIPPGPETATGEVGQ